MMPRGCKVLAAALALAPMGCRIPGTSQPAAGIHYLDIMSRGGPASDTNPGTKSRPWRTADRALAALTPGDTLVIRGGTYPGGIHVSCSGKPGRPITLSAFPGERVIFATGLGNARGIDLGGKESSGGNHIVLRGLEITAPIVADAKRINRSLIHGRGKQGVRIMDCVLQGGYTGIDLWYSHNVHIAGCRMGRVGKHGIQLVDGCTDVTIRDNLIRFCGELREKQQVVGGSDGIVTMGPLNQVGAVGTLGKVVPLSDGRFTFEILDAESAKPLNLNFKPWGSDIAGPAPGREHSPTILVLFEETKPVFPRDREMTGGGQFIEESGTEGFALWPNPAWNGKAFSPDGTKAVMRIGNATPSMIRKGKYAFLYHRFPNRDKVNRDLVIEDNEIHHISYEGIHIRVAENVLIRRNRIHHIGHTGIQIESRCRNIRIEQNNCRKYSRASRNESGIWYAGACDGIIQNNVCAEGVFGVHISGSTGVIIRGNRITDNRAQHVYRYKDCFDTREIGAGRHASGLYVIGHIPVKPYVSYVGYPVTSDIAILNNTILGNGSPESIFGGGVTLGRVSFGGPTNVVFLNNTVQGNFGREVMALASRKIRLDGNLYGTDQRPFGLVWRMPKADWARFPEEIFHTYRYDLAKPGAFSQYKNELNVDHRSAVIVRPTAENTHKREARNPDGAAPARTTHAGSGAVVPVTEVICFSAGFVLSDGRRLLEGDTITVGSRAAVVIAIDRQHAKLVLDRPLSWNRGDPIRLRTCRQP